MTKCEKCGEWINWDNPHIHYYGHVCDLGHKKSTKDNNGNTAVIVPESYSIIYKPETPASTLTPHTCPVCQGRGTVTCNFYSGETYGSDATPQTCKSCKGTGVLWG